MPAFSSGTGEQAKANSVCLAGNDCTVKTKAEVLAHNNFTLLRLDLDDVSYSMDEIKKQLRAFSIQSFVIHTTATHQQLDQDTGELFGNRYRVYIQLSESLPFDLWQILESYLSFKFKADDCATRPQQIMYLPNLFNGIKYDHFIADGDPLDLENGDLIDNAHTYYLKQKKITEQLNAKAGEAKPKIQFKEALQGGQVSLIEAVNVGYSWESLLLGYGYKRQGLRWLPPESKSGIAGVVIFAGFDAKEKYYSHNSSDPCLIAGHSLDQFDFLCIREYGGDQIKALKELGAMFPEITKHNRKQYAITRSNAEKLAVIGGVL